MPAFAPKNIAIVSALMLAPFCPAQASHPAGAKAASTEQQVSPPDIHAPLPAAAVIKQRVLENLKKMKVEQERYICHVARTREETDKHGNIKKGDVRDYDMFFVNGREIDELVAKNGKTLDASQQKKEAGRVKTEIEKDSDEKRVAKEQADDEKQLDTILHALRYTNGRRQIVHGRSTLFYDLSGDPSFHPKNVQETFLHNMSGTIAIDELTGELVDLNALLDHDVKIGGGLLANVHKGLWIHIHQIRQPDGVWISDLVEGKGDARAALFLHPYFQFKQTTSSCHLTDVTTQTGAGTVVDPASGSVKTD